MNKKMYMNIKTGALGTKDEWDYEAENGEIINAVDSGEVVEVKKVNGEWVEC